MKRIKIKNHSLNFKRVFLGHFHSPGRNISTKWIDENLIFCIWLRLCNVLESFGNLHLIWENLALF